MTQPLYDYGGRADAPLLHIASPMVSRPKPISRWYGLC